MRTLTALAIAALGATGAAASTNLIANGDFEAGNTGFTSSYEYVVPGSVVSMTEAHYSVATSAAATHELFANFGDHTTGTGQYMVLNGSSTADVIVWQQAHIAVTAFANYDFSAFIASVYPASPALLELWVTPDSDVSARQEIFANPVFGPYEAPSTVGTWSQINASFNVGDTSFITISFINQNTTFGGNDFGLDDIGLTQSVVPEPASWTLMIGGFAAVGLSARRRRNAVTA